MGEGRPQGLAAGSHPRIKKARAQIWASAIQRVTLDSKHPFYEGRRHGEGWMSSCLSTWLPDTCSSHFLVVR